MKSERDNKIQQKYGALNMQSYDIAGNSINAFYDSGNDLIFVLDNTINVSKPNVLLVINPDGDKKWDEILSSDYGVDLETIRPKQDNKYQKLDIEYSGLSVYDNLIKAYLADDDMEDFLVQLNVLRDSASRHSAMSRLNAANEIISKTNITIVKTKETIAKLQSRTKTLRAKLAATKKEIGRVSTKQSAAKILKIESQIEATNEKLKRAKKRLESAQRRLESATVDAELASNLLNQPAYEIPQNKSVVVAPKHEIQKMDDEMHDEEKDDEVVYEEYKDDDEVVKEETSDDIHDDVKPLFDQDPQILDEDIAFKPIAFNAQNGGEPVSESVPVLNNDVFEEDIEQDVEMKPTPVVETFESTPEIPESRPVLETMTPVVHEETDFSDIDEDETFVEKEPAVVPLTPVAPVQETKEIPEPVAPVAPVAPVVKKEPVMPVNTKDDTTSSRPTLIYYLLLLVLIILSIFTLWLYQKNMKTSSPVLTTTAEEAAVVKEPKRLKKPAAAPVAEKIQVEEEYDFLDEVEPVPETVQEPETFEQPTPEIEPEVEEYDEEDIAPEIVDAVPARVTTSGQTDEDVAPISSSEQEIIVNKPIYEPGSKHDDMFVADDGYYDSAEEPVGEYDEYYDAEEDAYLSGDDGYDE